jgi:hypothetical protein
MGQGVARSVRGADPVSSSIRSSVESVLDLASLERALPQLRARYASGCPFPHIVLDNFLLPEVVRRATDEFPHVDPESWINGLHVNQRKFGNNRPDTWGPTLQRVAAELNSPSFVRFLSGLTGIDRLFIDESMEGGGLHQSLAGGYLNIHADFTVHPHHRRWQRRLNLLLYLNDEWAPEYGGCLEFWSADVKRREAAIVPRGNRVVIFNTDMDSFHGHPDPLRCPDGTARRSMALYYFTEEDHPRVRSTEYRARPGEGPRAVLIYLDKQALRIYDRIKRRLRLSDHRASQFLRRLDRFLRREER